SDGTLVITGSRDDDHILVLLDHSGEKVNVEAGGRRIGQFSLADISSIQVNGFAGDDFIKIDRRLTVNALLQGGADNDVLIGGGGRNVIIGGTGRDVLVGG